MEPCVNILTDLSRTALVLLSYFLYALLFGWPPRKRKTVRVPNNFSHLNVKYTIKHPRAPPCHFLIVNLTFFSNNHKETLKWVR